MEGMEGVIKLLKTDTFGLKYLKSANFNFIKILSDSNAAVNRRAYKLVSIWVKTESDSDCIKQNFFALVKNCLKDGVSNRYTYRYAVRIICELFERLNNVDDLNKAILMRLQENEKYEKTLFGVLSLLNFFNMKYGPEKVDTVLFLEEIGNFSQHSASRIRNEALKFLVIAAKWKENTQSVLVIADKVLKDPQMKLLKTMLENIDKLEEPNYSETLEDSDDDAWYNKDGSKINKYEFLKTKFEDEDREKGLKYNYIFFMNTIRKYSWVDRVSKLDDIIFDLLSDKIVKEELLYISHVLINMLNSYNLNVVIKTMRLFQLLLLKFKGEMTVFIKEIRSSFLKCLSHSKAAVLIEIAKVFYYLKKYCLTSDEYLTLLYDSIIETQSIKSCKLLVETLV